MRLDIGEAAPKDLARASDRQLLDCVSKLSTTVVAAKGQSLDCLVRQHRALSFEHQTGDDILGRDELYALLLPAELAANGRTKFGVCIQAGSEITIMQVRHSNKSAGLKRPNRVLALRTTARFIAAAGLR
jgi:hypothetical protein